MVEMGNLYKITLPVGMATNVLINTRLQEGPQSGLVITLIYIALSPQPTQPPVNVEMDIVINYKITP